MLVAVLSLLPTIIVRRHIYFIIQTDVSEELDIGDYSANAKDEY